MDDLYALEGGGSATSWQRKHNQRKKREAALKARQAARAEAKADLKKRTAKWRVKWKARAAANKAAGLPPPTKHGRPRDISTPQWIDMTGQRFGRLTVLRVAPVSKNGKQHCRRWWVKCDCGHAEHLVSGTCLRQGIVHSCGCLKSFVGQARAARRVAEREKVLALPLSDQLAHLRRKILQGARIIRADAKILLAAGKALRGQEDALSPRRRRRRTSKTVH